MDQVFPLLLLITVLVIGIVLVGEVFAPRLLTEGFANLPQTTFWSSFAAPRSDIGPEEEDRTLVRDPRYFNDYADVSRLGVAYDFCRMVTTSGKDDYFFACALAGTENLDSTKFRTPSVKQGFRISRDDYMRDINGDGRAEYCRILKWQDGSYQPVCNRALDLSFDSKEVIDPEPPGAIEKLLSFYTNCVIWLRFSNDMKDYVENVKTQLAGGLSIDEDPKKKESQGIELNGVDQFLRLSDTSDLSLGFKVPIKSIRTWMVWVYFDEFTNNAKIFDFGNGKGKDNVFLGILASGDGGVTDIRPACGGGINESTVPTEKSGAQPAQEMPPQVLMASTNGNIDEYTCTGFEAMPRRLGPSLPTPAVSVQNQERATLLFEIWDQQSRKFRMTLNASIPKKTWTHICVTTLNDDAFRPDYGIFINGKQVYQKDGGFLPSTGFMTNCYLGKSNWANGVSQYENRDELFKGRLFDFRAYKASASQKLIFDSFAWGAGILGLE
jgi:hypothetical protein